MPSTNPVATKHAFDRALLLAWFLVLGALTATTVDACDRRREDGHCNYHVGIVTVNSSSNETVNWTVPADLTVYGVRLLWIEGSVTDDATVATGNSTFGDPVDGSSLTMFTTNANAPIVPNATFDSNVNLLSFTAPPSFYYNLTHGENISSVTNLTLKCPPTFLPEGTVLRLWNSDAISRGNNAGAPKYSWSLITDFATNTSSQTASRSNPSASQSRSVPSMTLSKSAEMASQTRTFTVLHHTRTRSRSVARTESKSVSRTAPTHSGTSEQTRTRTITPKFRTHTRSKTLQLPGFLGTVASGCSQMLQEGQLIYTGIMQLTTMPRRPPMCSAVYSYLATFQPSPSGLDATQRLYARTVLSIDPQPAIDAYWLTLPAALKQCPSCGPAATAVTQSCAAANNSVIRAVVSNQAKLMYPRCFATGTMTPGLTLSHTMTRRAQPTATRTRTRTLPAPTSPPPPTTTTAVPVTTTTPAPTTTAAPTSTLAPPMSTSSGNSTDAPSTAAPMPSTPSPTDPTPEPPSSVSPPVTTTSGNLTTSPASTAEVTSTAPATTAPPPVTMIPTTAAPPTQAPTMAPVTTVAPTPPPPTVYSPGALIQFTATVTLNTDGTVNMADFTHQLAVLLGVGESNIAPVLSGVNPANGTATVTIYFVGDERDKLQNKMAGLTSTQLATVGITSLGAAPAAIGTPSPPSNDLARTGGDVWIIGVGLLGALAVVGGVIFVLLRRHRGRLVAKVDVHNWDEEQLITVAGPALTVPPRGSRDAHFQL